MAVPLFCCLEIKFPSIMSIFGVELQPGGTFSWCVFAQSPILQHKVHFHKWYCRGIGWWGVPLCGQVLWSLSAWEVDGHCSRNRWPLILPLCEDERPHTTPAHTFLVFLFSFILVLGNLHFLPLSTSSKLGSENYFCTSEAVLTEESNKRKSLISSCPSSLTLSPLPDF